MAAPKRKKRKKRARKAMATAGGIVLVHFELKLPNGTNTPDVIVAGGADADRNGTVQHNGEYAAFTRNGNTWTHAQTVPGPTTGMVFYVQFTVGPNVAYEFVVKNAAGSILYGPTNNTTVGVTEYIKWTLQ